MLEQPHSTVFSVYFVIKKLYNDTNVGINTGANILNTLRS